MDIADVVNCTPDSVNQCGAATHTIVAIRQRLDLLNVDPIVQHLAVVGKQYGRHIYLSIQLFLLFNHCC